MLPSCAGIPRVLHVWLHLEFATLRCLEKVKHDYPERCFHGDLPWYNHVQSVRSHLKQIQVQWSHVHYVSRHGAAWHMVNFIAFGRVGSCKNITYTSQTRKHQALSKDNGISKHHHYKTPAIIDLYWCHPGIQDNSTQTNHSFPHIPCNEDDPTSKQKKHEEECYCVSLSRFLSGSTTKHISLSPEIFWPNYVFFLCVCIPSCTGTMIWFPPRTDVRTCWKTRFAN